jgi:RNA polymerase sigma-70 factor (ECF subfamily)
MTQATDSVIEGAGLSSVTEVYRQHGDFVWRTLQHLGIRDADLEDVLQEVFVVVHRRIGSFDSSSKMTTWLFGICLKTASRHRRRAYFRRERPLETASEEVDSSTPEHLLERRRAGELVEKALGRMALSKRAVFVLFEVEGRTCGEIAELLDVPVGTVYSRLHAARRDFQAALRRLGPSKGTST